jgi:hypothetical protein
MKPRTRFLMLSVILPLLFIPSCNDQSEAEIRAIFDDYVAALRNHNGAAAVAVVDERYFEDMDFTVNAARTAPREQVYKMRASERAMIAAIRNRLTKEEMKSIDARGLMKMMVDKNDTEEGDVPDYEITLGLVKFKPPRATAEIELADFPTGLRMEFVQVNNEWKINPGCFDEKFDKAVEKRARLLGVREDSVIRSRESRLTGKNVTEAIWDPPK